MLCMEEVKCASLYTYLLSLSEGTQTLAWGITNRNKDKKLGPSV